MGSGRLARRDRRGRVRMDVGKWCFSSNAFVRFSFAFAEPPEKRALSALLRQGLAPNTAPHAASSHLVPRLLRVKRYRRSDDRGPESGKRVIHLFPQQIFASSAVCLAQEMSLIAPGLSQLGGGWPPRRPGILGAQSRGGKNQLVHRTP